MHSGNAAATPEVRKDATLSFCHASRSVRITTAILVSNCIYYSSRHSGMRRQAQTRNPEVILARDSGFASSTRPGMTIKPGCPKNLPLGVAGPGADHAFLAAE